MFDIHSSCTQTFSINAFSKLLVGLVLKTYYFNNGLVWEKWDPDEVDGTRFDFEEVRERECVKEISRHGGSLRKKQMIQ